MSDLSTMIKRLLFPVIIATAAIQIPAQANTVRIIGPSAEEQSATVSQPTQRAADGNTRGRATITRYGPTRNDETLWSIASRYRPNNQVSVYQVIGAIHRANPQAFEHNNIHGLIPGSNLMMPTLAQIRQEDIDSVKRRLEADQRRKSRQASTPAPRPTATAKATTPKVTPKPEPTVVAKPLPKPEKAIEKTLSQPVEGVAKGGIPAKPAVLQQQLDASDEQITKLLESNHLLRVRLAEMQHEVTALKEQISDDDVLREQIKDFIQQQRVQLPQTVESQETWVDSLIASPWAMAALAFIPGSLIAGALAFFMLRRKKEDDVKSLDGPEGQQPAMVPPPEKAQEAAPELPVGEKDDDIDDLFGNGEESLFDDPENSLFAAETDLGADKQSDSIDILELATDENDEFEIDSGLSTSSISVKGDEQAIGLQDMERALDEMEQASEPGSDESLAAMWEQSLQDDADTEDSFDLSADSSTDALINDSMPDQDIEDGLLDQSILDDLLSEVEAENQAEETSAFSPEAMAGDEILDDAKPVKGDEPQPLIGQDELDSLFDAVAEPSPASAETEELAQQAAVDQALADADAIFTAEADALDEGEIDALFDENSTSLLDELIEDDELTSDIEIEENSTALLDELLDDEEPGDSLLNPDVAIDENSTALLDELVDDLDGDNDGLQDDTSAQPGLDAEEKLNFDDVVIDETSTDLLDDILAQHGSQAADVEAEQSLSAEEVMAEKQAEPLFSEAEAVNSELSDLALSEPEFEPAEETEAYSTPQADAGKPSAFDEADVAAPVAEVDELLADADFPEPPAFEDIFQDALEGSAEPEESEAPLAPSAQPSQEQLEGTEAENDVDAILADVEELLDEPQAAETDDVKNLERSVDDLLETFGSRQNEQPEELSPAIDDEAATPEVDHPDPEIEPLAPDTVAEELEENVLSGAGYDEFPTLDADEALAEAEFGTEPEQEFVTEPSTTEIAGEDADPLNLEEDFPEFDEEAAFNASEAEPLPTEDEALQVNTFSSSDHDAFPTFGEDEALAEAELEPEPEPEPEQEFASEPSEKEIAGEAAEPLNLEDFPEFDEEAAFNDPEAEPLPTEDETLQVNTFSSSDHDAFPTFGEDEALAEAGPVTEPEQEFATELSETEIAGEAAEPLNLEDFPEFDEEAAFNDPEAENLEEESSLLSEDEEQAALENIVKQLQQAAEAVEMPYQAEAADDTVVAAEPEPGQVAEPGTAAEDVPASIHGEQKIDFETIDPDSLPEFSENEALQASFDEQHELEQYELEQGLKGQPEIPPSPYEAEQPADMLDDEMVDSAGLDMAALLSDPEMIPAEPEVATQSAPDQADIPELADTEFVTSPESAFDAELEAEELGQPNGQEPEVELQPEGEATLHEAGVADTGLEPVGDSEDSFGGVSFDEPAYNGSASQGADYQQPAMAADLALGSQEELDAEREQLLSDAYDESLDSEEALAGHSGTEFDIPEEDSAIWEMTNPEPELETEDWAEQPQMQIEDVDAFDTEMLLAEAESQTLQQQEAGSELVDEQVNPPSYISIDELMKEMEQETPAELEDEPLNLEVGLDEFPDVLSGVEAFDVDSQGEYASKLDLAKAYLEMNDTEGAWGLLQEVADNGDAQSKREAKGLLERIRG